MAVNPHFDDSSDDKGDVDQGDVDQGDVDHHDDDKGDVDAKAKGDDNKEEVSKTCTDLIIV